MSQQNPNQSQDKQPQLKLTHAENYRDGYANSVQVRMSVWDFFLVFGITQRSEPRMMIRFGAFCFVLFVGGTIAASWIMWLIKH